MPVVRTLNFNAEEYSLAPRSLMSWMINGSKESRDPHNCKMQNGFWLGCVSPGPNQSKISFFHVPKGVMGIGYQKHGGSPKTILECCFADKFWKLTYSKCLDIWLLEFCRFISIISGMQYKVRKACSNHCVHLTTYYWTSHIHRYFPFDFWPYKQFYTMADDLASFIESQKRKLEKERAEILRAQESEVRLLCMWLF